MWLDEIQINSRADGFDNDRNRQINEVFAAAFGKDLSNLEPSAASKLAELYKSFNFGVSTMALKVAGFRASDDSTGATFSIGDTHLDISFDGTKDLVGIKIGLGATAIAAPSAKMQELLPQRINLDIRLDEFPMRELIAEFLDGLGDTTVAANENTNGTKDLSPMLGQLDFKKSLSEANSKLILKDLGISTGTARIASNGSVIANSSAVYGIVGTLDATIWGLDELIRITAERARRDPSLQGVQGILGLMKMYAKPHPATGGASPSYKFHVEQRLDGTITINDAPLQIGAAGNRR